MHECTHVCACLCMCDRSQAAEAAGQQSHWPDCEECPRNSKDNLERMRIEDHGHQRARWVPVARRGLEHTAPASFPIRQSTAPSVESQEQEQAFYNFLFFFSLH